MDMRATVAALVVAVQVLANAVKPPIPDGDFLEVLVSTELPSDRADAERARSLVQAVSLVQELLAGA